MINPTIAYRHELKLTQQSFADRFGLAYATVRRLEEGTLISVPPVIGSLLPITEITTSPSLIADRPPNVSLSNYEKADAAYHEWQRQARYHNGPELSRIKPSLSGHPFSPFTMNYSTHRLAVLLKIPPKAIQTYLGNRTQVVPRPVLSALSDAKYEHLDLLVELQRRYGRKQSNE